MLSEFVAEVARVAEEEVAVQFNDAQQMAIVPVPCFKGKRRGSVGVRKVSGLRVKARVKNIVSQC